MDVLEQVRRLLQGSTPDLAELLPEAFNLVRAAYVLRQQQDAPLEKDEAAVLASALRIKAICARHAANNGFAADEFEEAWRCLEMSPPDMRTN